MQPVPDMLLIFFVSVVLSSTSIVGFFIPLREYQYSYFWSPTRTTIYNRPCCANSPYYNYPQEWGQLHPIYVYNPEYFYGWKHIYPSQNYYINCYPFPQNPFLFSFNNIPNDQCCCCHDSIYMFNNLNLPPILNDPITSSPENSTTITKSDTLMNSDIEFMSSVSKEIQTSQVKDKTTISTIEFNSSSSTIIDNVSEGSKNEAYSTIEDKKTSTENNLSEITEEISEKTDSYFIVTGSYDTTKFSTIDEELNETFSTEYSQFSSKTTKISEVDTGTTLTHYLSESNPTEEVKTTTETVPSTTKPSTLTTIRRGDIDVEAYDYYETNLEDNSENYFKENKEAEDDFLFEIDITTLRPKDRSLEEEREMEFRGSGNGYDDNE